MIRYSFLLGALCFVNTAFSQLYCPPISGKTSFKNIHLSAGGVITILKGDISNPNTAGRAGYGKVEYTVVKGIDVGLEGQIGSFHAVGDVLDPREVYSDYKAILLGANIFPFLFASDNPLYNVSFGERLFRGLYFGVGVGQVFNNYGRIFRDEANPFTYGPLVSGDIMSDPLVFKKKTTSLLLPSINIGLSLPIGRSIYRKRGYWSIVPNVQSNFANNDYLDGYTPYSFDGKRTGTDNDTYVFYSLGVKYSF